MWQKIQGHDTIALRFRRAHERGRLAGSFLFVGPPGVGKRRFAFALAMGLLCKNQDHLNPCGACDSCKLFGGRSCTDFNFETDTFNSDHPDLYYVAKPSDKKDLPLELLIGDKKNRGHAGLCYNISLTASLGNRKVAIINDADSLNEEGANALLKTLEEPPPDAVLILIGTSTAKQLPTIRSRCQIVRFSPLPPEILSAILVEKGIVTSAGKQLAVQAEGSLDNARELADADMDPLRKELTKAFSAPHWDTAAFAAKLNGLIEASGKETPIRRRQARLIFGLALEHFRTEIYKGNADVCRTGQHLERTLDALQHIDDNINPLLVIEAWSAALGE
jgi:DNA polymerase-3 subunit delta'